MSGFKIDSPDPKGLSPYPEGWPEFSEVCSAPKNSGGVVMYDGPFAYCQATESCCQPDDDRIPYDCYDPDGTGKCNWKCTVEGYGPCCHVPINAPPNYDDSGDSDLVVASATEDSGSFCDTYNPSIGTNCAVLSPEVPPSWANEFGSGDDDYDRLTLTPCISVGQRHAMKTFFGILEKGIFEGSASVMASVVNRDNEEAKKAFLAGIGKVLVEGTVVGGAIMGALVAYRNAISQTASLADGFLRTQPLPPPPPLT